MLKQNKTGLSAAWRKPILRVLDRRPDAGEIDKGLTYIAEPASKVEPNRRSESLAEFLPCADGFQRIHITCIRGTIWISGFLTQSAEDQPVFAPRHAARGRMRLRHDGPAVAAGRYGGRRSARAEIPHVPGARQTRDLPLHAWRPFVDRHLRSQALPRCERRQAAADQTAADVRRRQDRRPDEVAVEVQEPRPERTAHQQSLPAISRECADDLCVVRSVVGEGVDHGAAFLQTFTGTFTFTRPSMGSWVLYGLGTREPQSARLHHHQAGAFAWRREELEFRISARLGAGNGDRPRRHAGGGDSEGADRIPDQPGPQPRTAAV